MPDDTATRLQKASTPIPSSFFSTLITANHILHAQSIVDAYGHISARSPQDPTKFFLSASVAPALVSSRHDIIEYDVSSASPVSDSRKGYLERYIHSEIYARYPDVMAVVHAHSEAVLPFSVSSVPLRPVFHMGGVMGGQPPVFDIAGHYTGEDGRHDLLVGNARLGAALAGAMTPSSAMGKAKGFLASMVSSAPEEVRVPACPVVLMRGHGFTATGASVEEVVYRSVYTCTNARVQTTGLLLQAGYNTGMLGEQIRDISVKEGRGSGPAPKHEGIKFLSDRECKESWEANRTQASRPWGLWVKEVREKGLYVNEFDVQDDEDEEEK